VEQPQLLLSLGMVNIGSSTKLFAGVDLAVPRLGNVRLHLQFLSRGTYEGRYLRPFCFLLIATLLLSGCGKSEDSAITPNTSITYSESPFALNGIQAKFAKDIAYDTKARTQLDIWLPSSNVPTGVVVYIHGGGFTSGDKDFVYTVQSGGAWDFPTDIRTLLQNKIAVATIRYTLLNTTSETEGIRKPLSDIRRAIQYLRYKSSDFNIDKSKVVLAGNSAGAGSALWIAFNNDMANSQSTDPVLKESTRVRGVVARETQSSYNIEDRWVNDVFQDYNVTWAEILDNETGNISKLYGVNSIAQYESATIDAYRAEVDMLSLMTSDDPEIWVNNTLRDVAHPYSAPDLSSHHAFHARALKARANAVGVTCIASYGRNPILYSDPSNETWVDFCIRKIQE
jgi:hypothetical protein